MNFKALLAQFYKFEEEHRLFERKDKNGVYYWDIFRYEIFYDMTFSVEQNAPAESKVSIIKLWNYLWGSITVLLSLTSNYQYLGYLASRNRYRDTGLFFDQNSYDVISKLPEKETILVESIGSLQPCVYGRTKRLPYPSLIKRIIRRNLHLSEAEDLVVEIKTVFPQSRISVDRINQLYSEFYAEKKLFTFLYKRWGVKKIFMTQNGILKGNFAAAKSLNVSVYEFQHGVVNNGHLAYSYPPIDEIDDKIYRASHLLTLSDFWLKDCFIPYTKVITLGNNYFIPQIDENKNPTENKILIASSAWMAKELKTFLLSALKNKNELRNYTFVYKLHPNEFHNVEEYRAFFKEFENVTVATNEKNVAQWMSECASMLTIYSTAAYEALQCQRKVIIFKKLSYEQMSLVQSCDNVYFIDNSNEFYSAIQEPIVKSNTQFFSPFNVEVANRIIND